MFRSGVGTTRLTRVAPVLGRVSVVRTDLPSVVLVEGVSSAAVWTVVGTTVAETRVSVRGTCEGGSTVVARDVTGLVGVPPPRISPTHTHDPSTTPVRERRAVDRVRKGWSQIKEGRVSGMGWKRSERRSRKGPRHTDVTLVRVIAAGSLGKRDVTTVVRSVALL